MWHGTSLNIAPAFGYWKIFSACGLADLQTISHRLPTSNLLRMSIWRGWTALLSRKFLACRENTIETRECYQVGWINDTSWHTLHCSESTTPNLSLQRLMYSLLFFIRFESTLLPNYSPLVCSNRLDDSSTISWYSDVCRSHIFFLCMYILIHADWLLERLTDFL
jgi:hypothetical protein